MSSIDSSSPFQNLIPNEINLNILSFLGKRDLQSTACTCTKLEGLSKDFQIWKPKTETEFGKLIANGAKQSNKSWKQTFEELDSSRKARVKNIGKVLQSHAKKTQRDNKIYATNRLTAAVFGFAMPNPSIHY